MHTNKGFLYSVKNILKNPGKTAREFIDGNRVNHYKPLGLVFILSGISAFISFKIIGLQKIMDSVNTSMNQNTVVMQELMNVIQHYNAVIMLLFIPVLALLSKISFNDWKQNYYEHTVMNAFGMAYYVSLTILIVYPIMFICRDNLDLSFKVSAYAMVTVPFMMLYFYKNFYPEQTKKAILIRVFLKTILFAFAYIGIIIIATMGLFIKYGVSGLKPPIH